MHGHERVVEPLIQFLPEILGQRTAPRTVPVGFSPVVPKSAVASRFLCRLLAPVPQPMILFPLELRASLDGARKFLLELVTRPAEPHLAGADRKFENLRQLFVAVLFRIFENHQLAVFLVERVEHLHQIEREGRGIRFASIIRRRLIEGFNRHGADAVQPASLARGADSKLGAHRYAMHPGGILAAAANW